jgi:hypothetical protein
MKKTLFITLLILNFVSMAAISTSKPQWQFMVQTNATSASGNNSMIQNNSSVFTAQRNVHPGYQIAVQRMVGHESWLLNYTDLTGKWKSNTIDHLDYTGKDTYQALAFQHGYQFTLSPKLLINLHAGFSTISEKSTNDSNQTNQNGLATSTSQFSGFGPSMGYFLLRQLGMNLTFSNTIDAGIAYGASHSNAIDNGEAISTPNHQMMVPYLGMGIALGYHTAAFTPSPLLVETGVQFRQLYGVVTQNRITNSQQENLGFYNLFVRMIYTF